MMRNEGSNRINNSGIEQPEDQYQPPNLHNGEIALRISVTVE